MLKPELEEKAAQLAADARCQVCWGPVTGVGSSVVSVRLIGVEKLGDYYLCPSCTDRQRILFALPRPEDT